MTTRSILIALLILSTASAPAFAKSSKPSVPSAQPSLARPAPRLEQAYQLGVATYTPPADVERLDAIIKLRHMTTPQLAVIANQTRAAERDGYRAALAQLRRMSAPPAVANSFTGPILNLQQPLTISDQARKQVPDDADAQRVWSTLDEADLNTPKDNGALTAWLKLSRGRDALWAYHIGNLAAVIRARIPGESSNLPLVSGAGALLESAPRGAPQPLLDALKTVADQANHHGVTADALTKLDNAILDVFGPGPSIGPDSSAPSAR